MSFVGDTFFTFLSSVWFFGVYSGEFVVGFGCVAPSAVDFVGMFDEVGGDLNTVCRG